MTSKKNNYWENPDTTTTPSTKGEQASTPAADDEADREPVNLQMEEYKLKAEEYYSQLQRLKAEFDNFRKRTIKEKEEYSKYASEKLILALLPVLDNFERAVDSASANKDYESLSQGVNLIFRQFFKVLEDEGLKSIESVGIEFDPNVHEAFLREASDKEENIILEELQKGYYLKDKVIRPSRVKVSG